MKVLICTSENTLNGQRCDLNHHTRELSPLVQFLELGQFTDPEPLD